MISDEYKKSSYSGNGGCVEVKYVKASSCYHGGCVEVGITADAIYLRDSKNPDKPAHEFTPREWEAFLAGVRNNEFDLPNPT